MSSSDDESLDLNVLSTPVNPSQSTCERSKRKLTSDVWNKFHVVDDKAVCSCGASYSYKVGGSSGTSSLRRHLRTCGSGGDQQQAIVYGSYTNSFMSASTSFDQSTSFKALVDMIVAHDLPFAFADYSGLNVFLKGLNPNFKLVSGKTVRSHMFKHYETAKVAVQELPKLIKISSPTS